MMNNKGQTLVIFVVFLPIIIIIMATVVDVSLMYYQKNKLDNINMMVTEYGINHFEDNDNNLKLESLIYENDKDIEIKKILIDDSRIEIILNKKIKSIFGKIIGLEEYEITSKYIGTNIDNKKEIKKG